MKQLLILAMLGIIFRAIFLLFTTQPENTTYEGRQACDMGDSVSCNNLGLYYDDGEGVKQSDQQASILFKKACDMGEGVGCFNLGIYYANGQGVKQSYQQAKVLYGKACDMGYEDGCKESSSLNKQGY